MGEVDFAIRDHLELRCLLQFGRETGYRRLFKCVRADTNIGTGVLVTEVRSQGVLQGLVDKQGADPEIQCWVC
jgi:hypothetical protein